MPSAAITLDTIDPATLADIAKSCELSTNDIVDIYECTDFQMNTVVESAIRSSSQMYRYAFKLAHTIDIDRLCSAVKHVVSLNEILRTRIVDTRLGFVQVITNEPHRTERLYGDLDDFFSTDRQPAHRALGGPMFRSAIINRSLALTINHAIMDATAWFSILADIVTIYRGQEPPRRPLFKHFVSWCKSIDDSEAKAFWAARFKGVPITYPPIDSGYTPMASTLVTSTIDFGGTVSQVPVFHMPAYIELSFALTLATYAGGNNIAYGMTLSGRNNSASHEFEAVMGPLVTIVPVQARWTSASSVGDMLKYTRSSLRQLQTSPALQYGSAKIRESSEAARAASGFQAVLNLHPPFPEVCDTGELAVERSDDPANGFAMIFQCIFLQSGMLVRVLYDPNVLVGSQTKRIVNQFEHILNLLLEAELDSILMSMPLLNEYDRAEIVKWNTNNLLEPLRETLHDSFRHQAHKTPETIAVEAVDGSMSYRELDNLSDLLANELTRRGLSMESPIAFVFRKTMWTPVAVLGILKAGCTCVPINPDDPASRKAALVSSAGVQMVLVSSKDVINNTSLTCDVLVINRDRVSEFAAVANHSSKTIAFSSSVTPDRLAYIIFTSGSTGTPKGVLLEHGCIHSAIKAVMLPQNLQTGFRLMQYAAHVWDASIVEMLGTLIYGGCLCIPSEEQRLSGLTRFIQSKLVESALLTPTMLRSLSPDQLPSLKVVLSIGESVDTSAHMIWGSQARLLNMWGPCEGGIANTMAHLTPSSPFPETIGRPNNCMVWIVYSDNVDILCPVGVAGELLIEGHGVARGYLNDPVASKASFIRPPTWRRLLRGMTPNGNGCREAARFYRTGDLGRYNSDGSICYLGRKDSQIKIRGQRFEPAEVEGVLLGSVHVKDAFASTKIYQGRNELVAVFSLADIQLPLDAEVLQVLPSDYANVQAKSLQSTVAHCRLKLPSHMVPSIWLVVQKLPQTASGKVDRHRIDAWLKSKDVSMANVALSEDTLAGFTEPTTTEEKMVQSAWAEFLGIPETIIGRQSSFTQLGGNSILAMHVSSHLFKSGLIVSAYSLLQNQPLESIAKAAQRSRAKIKEKSIKATASKKANEPSMAGLYERLSRLGKSEPRFQDENIECIVPATDTQALFLAVGPPGVEGEMGYHLGFSILLTPALDSARLQTACVKVLQRDAILRTVFFRHGSKLYQVVLKKPHSGAVTIQREWDSNASDSPPFFHKTSILARFCLFGQGNLCHRLRIDIHHALYDAIGFSLILRHIHEEYSNSRPPAAADGPRYHDWISYVEALDGTAPRQFWRDVLRDSSMTHLVTPQVMPENGYMLGGCFKLSVPLHKLDNIHGTPSTSFKAAWAVVLSAALGKSDVVFGEISSNRFLDMPDTDQLCGPCINFVPVRATFSDETSLSSLVAKLQDQGSAGMQYHHLGMRSIIRDCTTWPSSTHFSTCISYQDHNVAVAPVTIGNANGMLSITAKAAGSSDIMIGAIPRRETLHIELYYNSDVISATQMVWIRQSLETVLSSMPISLDKTLRQAKENIYECSNAWPMTGVPPLSNTGDAQYAQESPLSESTRGVVLQAWQEVGLFHIGQGERDSMFSTAADIVSAMLLSERYHELGFLVSIKDIVRHPTRLLQAHLLSAIVQSSKPIK
ncbi:hypothetical protein QQS21_003916 [Conoideocrella luteorostrata]|uniref:Carrier domain-containing protein n=1 Tax=Conoideocrella luteorostrata TaxID=1105319 RepID=A0AAJ0G077_9HYPO|nr:hypothetical protein QQS21_003916 [Conoideocrella luteorostrata]